MPALANLDHERFCQALHKRVWAGERQSEARTTAYRETMAREPDADSDSIEHNARRLANKKPIKERLAELAEFSAKLVGVDAGWAMVKLKQVADGIERFNLDDYLGEPKDGERFHDLSRVPREHLALLSELSIEDETRIEGGEDGEDAVERRTRKIKLKGPAKSDMVGPIALMSRIAGWEAPRRSELTGKGGGPVQTEAQFLISDADRVRALEAFMAKVGRNATSAENPKKDIQNG